MTETGREEVWLDDGDGWWCDVWDVGGAFNAATRGVLVERAWRGRGHKPDNFVADAPWTGFHPAWPRIDETFAMFIVMCKILGIFRSSARLSWSRECCCVESGGDASGC